MPKQGTQPKQALKQPPELTGAVAAAMRPPPVAFVGIDVSKLTFDAALTLKSDQATTRCIREQQFDNTPAGLKKFGKWLCSHGASLSDGTVVVMENTGIYHQHLWRYCAQAGLFTHIGNAAGLKLSMGLVRGKNDRVDARRLCDYAMRHADRLSATPALDESVIRLRDLRTTRARLLCQLSATRAHLAEAKRFSEPATYKLIEQGCKAAIRGLESSIVLLESQIKVVIASCEKMKVNYRLVLSVPGIGHWTAVYLLCCTANFVASPGGKQLACYAGIAPFEHSSGTSVRGRTRVHHMGNKELKCLLHMGALSAIRHNQELQTYYERKMAQGKHHLSALNAVKNKMVMRVAAVVKSGQTYVSTLAPVA